MQALPATPQPPHHAIRGGDGERNQSEESHGADENVGTACELATEFAELQFQFEHGCPTFFLNTRKQSFEYEQVRFVKFFGVNRDTFHYMFK